MTLEAKGNIVGGPLDNTGAAPVAEAAFPDITGTAPAPAPAPAAPAAPVSTTPVIIGDRVFTDQEAALKYANDLATERQKYITSLNAPAPVAAPTNNKVPLHQLMFEDPEAYERELRASIKNEIRSETQQVDTNKAIWDGFYRDHKDLQGLEDAVELQRTKHWNQLQGLPVDQGLKFLAAQTRSYVANIRGNANPGERVNSGPAPVAGATGTPAPRIEVQAQRPSTFMDELKDFRNSKRLKQPKGA